MRPSTTPFAQNILPKLAAWFQHLIQRDDPNYLVPVERKGAHLLDAILAYLGSPQSTPIRASVLYKRAFTFLPSTAVERARILLLDDATHTGKTLAGYRAEIRTFGNANVRMLACVGVALALDDGLPRVYTSELYQRKCAVLFEHVFETFGEGGVTEVTV